MPRRRPKVDQIRFVRFAQEQRDALPILLQLPDLKSVFDTLARDGHREEGRGLIVWVSTDGTFATLQPPVFVPAAVWKANPLLVNTAHTDLIQALITYDRHTSYIVLVASPAHAQSSKGYYTWWIERFDK
jgi:hypothetical protein